MYHKFDKSDIENDIYSSENSCKMKTKNIIRNASISEEMFICSNEKIANNQPMTNKRTLPSQTSRRTVSRRYSLKPINETLSASSESSIHNRKMEIYSNQGQIQKPLILKKATKPKHEYLTPNESQLRRYSAPVVPKDVQIYQKIRNSISSEDGQHHPTSKSSTIGIQNATHSNYSKLMQQDVDSNNSSYPIEDVLVSNIQRAYKSQGSETIGIVSPPLFRSEADNVLSRMALDFGERGNLSIVPSRGVKEQHQSRSSSPLIMKQPYNSYVEERTTELNNLIENKTSFGNMNEKKCLKIGKYTHDYHILNEINETNTFQTDSSDLISSTVDLRKQDLIKSRKLLQAERNTLWKSLQLENNRLKMQLKILQQQGNVKKNVQETWSVETQTIREMRSIKVECAPKMRNSLSQTVPIDLDPHLSEDIMSANKNGMILDPNDTILIFACACVQKLRQFQNSAKVEDIMEIMKDFLEERNNLKMKRKLRKQLQIAIRNAICTMFDDFTILKEEMNSLVKDKAEKKIKNYAQIYDSTIGAATKNQRNTSVSTKSLSSGSKSYSMVQPTVYRFELLKENSIPI